MYKDGFRLVRVLLWYFSISSRKLQNRICAQLKESPVSKTWFTIGTHFALNKEQLGKPNNLQNMVANNEKGYLNQETGYAESETGITSVGSSSQDFTTCSLFNLARVSSKNFGEKSCLGVAKA